MSNLKIKLSICPEAFTLFEKVKTVENDPKIETSNGQRHLEITLPESGCNSFQALQKLTRLSKAFEAYTPTENASIDATWIQGPSKIDGSGLNSFFGEIRRSRKQWSDTVSQKVANALQKVRPENQPTHQSHINAYKSPEIYEAIAYEFFTHLFAEMQNKTKLDLKNSIIGNFEHLDKLIDLAKNKGTCESFSNLFTQLFDSCFVKVAEKIKFNPSNSNDYGTKKWLYQIVRDIKANKIDMHYLLHEFEEQRSSLLVHFQANNLSGRSWICDSCKEVKRFYNEHKAEIRAENRSVKELTLYSGSSDVKITRLPNDLHKWYPNLERLNLDFQALTKIPDVSGFEHLTVLQLMHNEISQVTKEDVDNLKSLEYLDLSDNGIKQLDSSLFSEMQNIKVLLILNGNTVSKSLSPEFYLKHLKEIDADSLLEYVDRIQHFKCPISALVREIVSFDQFIYDELGGERIEVKWDEPELSDNSSQQKPVSPEQSLPKQQDVEDLNLNEDHQSHPHEVYLKQVAYSRFDIESYSERIVTKLPIEDRIKPLEDKVATLLSTNEEHLEEKLVVLSQNMCEVSDLKTQLKAQVTKLVAWNEHHHFLPLNGFSSADEESKEQYFKDFLPDALIRRQLSVEAYALYNKLQGKVSHVLDLLHEVEALHTPVTG